MPFDALTLSVLTKELSANLVGGKITKITQPEKDEIVLHIYNGQSFRLLVSASTSVPRIHLTDLNKENPSAAPSFCMLLRKYLTGGQILRVWQQPFERVIILDIYAGSELGDKSEMRLICEITGKSANIFFTDENYKILGSVKSVPLGSLSERPTLTGQTYQFLQQDKLKPCQTEEIYQLLEKSQPGNVSGFLKDKLMGLSWTTLNEILRDETNYKKSAERFVSFLKYLEKPNPQIVLDGNDKPVDVLAADYQTVSGKRQPFDSLNNAFDEYFREKDNALRHGEKTRRITQLVRNALKRTENKIALQKDTLLTAQNNEQNRIYGDLILSNLHRIKRGDKTLNAENYYDNGNQVSIPLDELFTPQQNAQRYYKKYAKQKKTVEYTTKLLAENEIQLSYLQSIMLSLGYPLQNSDIEDILQELQSLKLADRPNKKNQQVKKKMKATAQSKPMRYEIEGYTVLVGKNNTQNDRLTFSQAKPDDIWMHTKDLHSAHLIVCNPDKTVVPGSVLQICAEITAYYSQARDSLKVPVDFTQKRNVKKPSGSPPGFVHYETYQTCLVNPNSHIKLAKL